MILTCSNLSKSFNEKKIIQQASFHLEDYDKAAIVGINGAGKTTLLRMIMGELEPDEGVVACAKDKTIGYLSQLHAVNSDATIYEELFQVKKELIQMETSIRQLELDMKHATGDELETLMNRYTRVTHDFELQNGYAYRSELIGVLKGLGFTEDEFQKSIATLSGGQKTRVALGKLLLLKPDLIILDEPTNHLDLSSISWLETYLLNYKGAVLLVSHDRFFLDRITNKIIEIDFAKTTVFSGNYSDYAKKKEHLRLEQIHAFENQQREIKHQEEVITKLRSFNREKSIKRAESREKMLDKIEVLEKPRTQTDEMKLTLVPNKISGNDVLRIQGLEKSFGNHQLFHKLDLDIKRGEHVAIIGDNGTGKTTLLKIINQIIPSDGGTITPGTNVSIGYYDQEHQLLDPNNTLFDEISNAYPSLSNTKIRNTLAAFLFTNDDAFKYIKDLSGGERGRVSLAKLMLSECNFLILDEPTNHLDMASKEILEQALNAYTGTILYVSHDRYFINKTATRIFDLHKQMLIPYEGNYDFYLEKKDLMEQLYESAAQSSSPSSNSSAVVSVASVTPTSVNDSLEGLDNSKTEPDTKLDWKAQKEIQAQQRKKENDLKKCEDAIAKLELLISDLDEKMSLPEHASNSVKLQELALAQEKATSQLEQLYAEWEQLSE